MALELLAGPFDLTYKSSPVYCGSRVMWVDAIGFVGSIVAGALVDGVVWGLDGVVHDRNPLCGIFRGGITHNLVTRGIASKVGFDGRQGEDADPYTFMERGTVTARAGVPATVLSDRWLTASGQNIQWTPRQSAAGPVTECTLSESIGNVCWITPARGQNRVMVGGDAGVAFEYDYAAKQAVNHPRRLGMASLDGLFYSRALGVWLSLSRTTTPAKTQLRIWADEIAPTTISAPTALDTVAKGGTSRLRVQMTGAHSEPCAGMRVEWAIGAGSGTVQPAQSLTDADGYAQTILAIPPGAAGSVRVDVEAIV